MRTILTTVGISLLGNAGRALEVPRGVRADEQQLANYLRHTSPEAASAETNALHRLVQSEDRLVFLHSETDEGTYCAEALCRHYERAGFTASALEVSGLAYAEQHFAARGLRALVRTLIEQIREARKAGREVLINATGGFKAEIAFATLIGLLFHVPVYYIHEQFGALVEMPPLPIGWDYALLWAHEPLVEWVYLENPSTADLEQRLKGQPETLRLLFQAEEGIAKLSPMGIALYEAYQDEGPMEGAPLLLSSAAVATYAGAESQQRSRLDELLYRLQQYGPRGNHSSLLPGGGCKFPRGYGMERILYEDHNGTIYVCHLSLDHDHDPVYKRANLTGVTRSDYSGFASWPPR